ncbi:MAG: hypothetical protein IJ566_05165 [Cardiobacteriaceae bacterium]|nr:hypothetical protein [Cardiobacteriaceae bacterium]
MKKINIVIIATLAYISGCTSMMYGSGYAPVSNQNQYAGRPQHPQQQPYPPQQYQQPQASVRGNIPNNTVNNPPQYNERNTRIVPPSVQQQNQGVAQPAPYQAARQQQGSSWDTPAVVDTPKVSVAAPQQQQQPARDQNIYDEPKYDRRETAKKEEPREEPKPEAVRPAEIAKPAPAAAETPAASSEKTVASNQKTASSGGAQDLIGKANTELKKGNLDKAASYLEDASRIDSGNSKIMYDIANIRYHQGKYRAAEQMAARAARAGGSAGTQKKSWELISHARDKLGDKQGAVAAAEKAASM